MFRIIFHVSCWLLLTVGSADAQSRAAVERDFQAWVAGDLWAEAKAAGVSRATFDKAFAGIALDWDLPELVPPGTSAPHRVEHQAEFRSPGAYFGESGINALVSGGRSQLSRHRKTLDAIEARFGVPREVLVAVWARETGYGQAALPHPAIRALATGAFIGRRKEFFRKELIAALQILEAGDITPSRMKSSWAGALGQPQFLPSYYLNYAVDFDGDRHRDIWESVPDTLASIANFLKAQGWNPERSWGVEARVPADIRCSLEGPEQGRPMAEWAADGVTRIDGKPLPGLERNRTAYLLMPAGRLGPAFIVTENFYTLKTYNNSDLYALYIVHLAARFESNKSFVAKWGKTGGFTRGDVARMQKQLEAEGHDVGGSDGLVGFKTRIAVGKWQAAKGKAETCQADAGMVKGIR